MCSIFFRNPSWVWGVDRKIQACRVMQDYDSEGRIFRSTCHARKILFLAYFIYHFWRLITLIVDIFHIVISFPWCLMTALTSLTLTLTMVYLVIPIQSVDIKSLRSLNLYLTLDNFSFAVCFYNHAIFQYMYLKNQFSDSSITWILSGILSRYTWYILVCRMKVHK